MQNGNWGNAAFAAVNAVTATYALMALMGVRNLLVDLWVGFVEHLYVTDKPRDAEPVQRRRRRALPEPAPAPWQDVLYRGAAATATGTHHAEASGSFRVLAVPPAAPPEHNRRESDRSRAAAE